jgi:hypothetical protein
MPSEDDETIDHSSPPPESLPEQTESCRLEVKKKRKRSHEASSLKASPFDHLKPEYRFEWTAAQQSLAFTLPQAPLPDLNSQRNT